MLNRLVLLSLTLLIISEAGSQTTYVPLWAKETWFLDRLEIKAQTNSDLNLSTVKPYMRKAYVAVADSFRNMLLMNNNPAALTPVDQYNLNRFQANNREYSRYTTDDFSDWKSKKPWGEYFFPTKGNFFEVNTKDFYLSVNPVINQQQGFEKDYDQRLFVNSKGVTARGLLAKKIAFNFYLTDNQERGPLHFRQYVDSNKAVPGGAFWKDFKRDGVDYFDARGSVNWNVTKYINMQFGYDQHFIGSGYRSLFLSNFSPPQLFLKFNTRIWKINYTNIFSELFPTFGKKGDLLLDRKYSAMHHFSINATKWLTVGAFEAIVFGRENRFDFSYLLPVIFYRAVEGNNGSPDNANIGFDVKANLAKRFQVYGQLLLDELNVSELRKDRTWWGNKQAFQLGAKYVDVFGIKNLDAQLEWNRIRPFTYSHYDSTASYTHYLQPLANPHGANVQETIGILRYQPTNKLYLMGRLSYWKQGLDSAGFYFGANPNTINPLIINGGKRLRQNDFPMYAGIPSKGVNIYGVASYEFFENLFVDASILMRTLSTQGKAKETIVVPTIGLRWNMFRREYDF